MQTRCNVRRTLPCPARTRPGLFCLHKAVAKRSRSSAVQVHAAINNHILAPILLGVGAAAGIWLNNEIRKKSQAAAEQRAKSKQPSNEQQQQDLLTMRIQKQNQQLSQLTCDKQQLQQEGKKQAKAHNKLQAQLANTEQELAALKHQYSAVSVELLQAKGDLDQANKQLQALQQKEAQHAGFKSFGLSEAQRNGADIAAGRGGAATAAANSSRLRVAFVGGRNLKDSHRNMLPLGCQVRHFGSSRDIGEGEIRSLEASLKAGTIDEVYVLTRWNGHNTTQRVTKLCRRLDIPVHMLSVPELTRTKGRAGAAAADSEGLDWEA